jgi:hypothetical protein
MNNNNSDNNTNNSCFNSCNNNNFPILEESRLRVILMGQEYSNNQVYMTILIRILVLILTFRVFCDIVFTCLHKYSHILVKAEI